jgi:type III secretion protein T
MEIGQSLTSFKDAEIYIIAIAVGIARVGAMLTVMPAFTRLGLTGLVRGGTALAFSLPLIPIIVPTIALDTMDFSQIAVILLKEVAVGMLIGLVLGIPIWAAEAAGEILDLQRGVTFAELVDPTMTTHNNVLGTFLALVMVALFFLGGGVALTLRTIYDSYSLWPLANMTPILSAEAGDILLSLLDDLMGLGLLLVAPIVLSLLLADLALALVARAAPHMNIFVLSLPVKNLAMAVLLVLYGAFLISYMKDNLGLLINGQETLRRLAPQ